MSPSLGFSNPAIMRISVVLPQPDGPRIEKNDPLGTPNETESTAVKLPNRLVTLLLSRSYTLCPQYTCFLGQGRVAHAPAFVSARSTCQGESAYSVAALIRSSARPSMSSRPGGMLAKNFRLSRSL